MSAVSAVLLFVHVTLVSEVESPPVVDWGRMTLRQTQEDQLLWKTGAGLLVLLQGLAGVSGIWEGRVEELAAQGCLMTRLLSEELDQQNGVHK